MLFNSIEYLFFLPIVFLLYWLVFKRLRVQNSFILGASYLFYGWWDWRFLVLIALTTLLSFLSGILIERYHGRSASKWFLWSNVFVNLAILGLFKYFNFFTTNLQALLSPLGVHLDSITVNLILPVGISFYTFQALSYSIDVYRDKTKATKDIVAFFAFISFFPQLVAGPIERSTNLLPQFLKPRKFNYALAVDGCRQILWGLFKKMVIADNCATVADAIFDNYNDYGGLNLWIGALMFTFQIYGDFSGYSDIAIGTAKLFDIKLMRNFHNPYFSRDIAEFWRKWHISLTTWFRDYIYIPLGGSRVKKSKVARNTFVIFLVSGLWHGAEWTFVVWGAYHAVLFLPSILLGKNRKWLDTVGGNRVLPSMAESLLMAWTFLLVLIGWVIFRGDNITIVWDYIERMFKNWHFSPATLPVRPLLFIFIMLCVEWAQRGKSHPFELSEKGLLRYSPIRWSVYLVITWCIIWFQGISGEFIYFQF